MSTITRNGASVTAKPVHHRGRKPKTDPDTLEMLKSVAVILSDGQPHKTHDIAADLGNPVWETKNLSPKIVYLTGAASEPLRVEIGLTGHKGDGTAYGAVVRIGPATFQWVAQARWLDANLVRLPRGMTQGEARNIATNVTSYSPWYETRTGALALPSQDRAMGRRLRRKHTPEPERGATLPYRLAHGYYAPDEMPEAPHVGDHDVPAEVLKGWDLSVWKSTVVPAWGDAEPEPAPPAAPEAPPVPWLGADQVDPEPVTITVTHEPPPSGAVELVAADQYVGGTVIVKIDGRTVVATINSIIG